RRHGAKGKVTSILGAGPWDTSLRRQRRNGPSLAPQACVPGTRGKYSRELPPVWRAGGLCPWPASCERLTETKVGPCSKDLPLPWRFLGPFPAARQDKFVYRAQNPCVESHAAGAVTSSCVVWLIDRSRAFFPACFSASPGVADQTQAAQG